MTLPRLDVIVEHWKKVPPLAVSVAAIATALGVGREKAATKKKTASSAAELFDLLGGTGFSTSKPEWLRTT